MTGHRLTRGYVGYRNPNLIVFVVYQEGDHRLDFGFATGGGVSGKALSPLLL